MGTSAINQVDIINDNYETIVKDSFNILNEINFESDDDALIMKSIISSLEKEAAQAVRDNKCVSIPYVGCVRKNAKHREALKIMDEIKESYRNMSAEEYRAYCKRTFKDIALTVNYNEYVKRCIRHIRAINREEYDRLTFLYGIHYANIYIKSIYWLEYIPFDPEVQAAYDRLNE